MFLRCFNYIQINQQPTDKYPNRNKIMSLQVVNRYEVQSSWENLTNNAKVVIPKNIVAKDLSGNDITLQGTNVDIGFGDNPLFLRGDKISIQAGHWYDDALGVEQQYVRLLFDGYISKVYSKLDITLECEDNAWILKQIPAPDKIWGDMSLQAILTECIKGSVFAANGGVVKTQAETKVTFDIGTFYTKNETVAQVMARIKKDYRIGCYVKDNEIRIGRPTYFPADVQDINHPFVFDFQKNIISNSLQYMRKDDITLSATAESFYSEKQSTTTLDGKSKTRKKKLKVFIYSDKKTQTLKSKVITDDSQIPKNVEGERFDFKFPFATSTGELIKSATAEIEKKYYTGFRGAFTTFGIPYIPFGDNVKIVDAVLPDRNGIYKVKGVNYSGGEGIGIRQEIHLDYKIE